MLSLLSVIAVVICEQIGFFEFDNLTVFQGKNRYSMETRYNKIYDSYVDTTIEFKIFPTPVTLSLMIQMQIPHTDVFLFMIQGNNDIFKISNNTIICHNQSFPLHTIGWLNALLISENNTVKAGIEIKGNWIMFDAINITESSSYEITVNTSEIVVKSLTVYDHLIKINESARRNLAADCTVDNCKTCVVGYCVKCADPQVYLYDQLGYTTSEGLGCVEKDSTIFVGYNDFENSSINIEFSYSVFEFQTKMYENPDEIICTDNTIKLYYIDANNTKTQLIIIEENYAQDFVMNFTFETPVDIKSGGVLFLDLSKSKLLLCNYPEDGGYICENTCLTQRTDAGLEIPELYMSSSPLAQSCNAII